MKIIFFGDICGKPGRKAVKSSLEQIREEFSPDILISNAENSAGGFGITSTIAEELFKAGLDFITTGNHIWSEKEVYPYLAKNGHRMIRPMNYNAGVPGIGYSIFETKAGEKLGIINAMGRVFMNELVDCPFTAVTKVLENEFADLKNIFVDFHAEATSEKCAFGYFLDGKVSAVVGTHTHVQTADNRVLPKGTAYISDVGMCGVKESVLGMDKDQIVERFSTSLPIRFEIAKGEGMINAVFIELDPEGKALQITNINRVIV